MYEYEYSEQEFELDCRIIVEMLESIAIDQTFEYVYGVPRGGVKLAKRISEMTNLSLLGDDVFQRIYPVEKNAILVVDDIIDSGETMNKFVPENFVSIHTKPDSPQGLFSCKIIPDDVWIRYFWEDPNEPMERTRTEVGVAVPAKPSIDCIKVGVPVFLEQQDTPGPRNQQSFARPPLVLVDDPKIPPVEELRSILRYIGENPDREGLLDTPNRIIRSWDTMYGGYKQDAADFLKKQFNEGACDDIVLLSDIEFYSTCEHHMIPFFGKAHIAYHPGQFVFGISKLARVLEVYTRRMQIQERIGQQVVDALMTAGAKGAACFLEAQHMCMTCRGVNKQHSVMKTSCIKGTFLELPHMKLELMQMIRG